MIAGSAGEIHAGFIAKKNGTADSCRSRFYILSPFSVHCHIQLI